MVRKIILMRVHVIVVFMLLSSDPTAIYAVYAVIGDIPDIPQQYLTTRNLNNSRSINQTHPFQPISLKTRKAKIVTASVGSLTP